MFQTQSTLPHMTASSELEFVTVQHTTLSQPLDESNQKTLKWQF